MPTFPFFTFENIKMEINSHNPEAWNSKVKHGVFVSSIKYSSKFDHTTLVSGIARTCSQRGIAVRPEPTLPGGKRADLAISVGDGWTYIEVKTRANGYSGRKRGLSLRQNFLREILRLRAHSLKQLPAKESSLMVLAMSESSSRRKTIGKIAIANSLASKFFDHGSGRILGLMIFAPFRDPNDSNSIWKYASTVIRNPHRRRAVEPLDELCKVQL